MLRNVPKFMCDRKIPVYNSQVESSADIGVGVQFHAIFADYLER